MSSLANSEDPDEMLDNVILRERYIILFGNINM